VTTPRQEQENAAARAEVTAAVERAAAEGKHVLVVFGADWCQDSAALEDLFAHPLVSALLEAGFEVVHLDAGNRDRHVALARGWGLDYAAGLPTVAVLDPRGELLHATQAGELAAARTLTPIDLATRIHRWMPEGATG
jgi:thiol:disulfide interchange protein